MIGRFAHPSAGEPRTPLRSPAATALAATAVVAILGVVAVALAYRAGDRHSDVDRSELANLSTRISTLNDRTAAVESSVGDLQTTAGSMLASLRALRKDVHAAQASAQAASKQARAAIAEAKTATAESKASAGKLNPQLATCLQQIQNEIDDLQAYVVYRYRLHRGRVSGSCVDLLGPRYG
jgi:chromosome segregation ATPase